MSQGHRRSAIAIADEDWDDVLAQLRADGFSVIEAIKITRAVRQVDLAEAKRMVHSSPAWADNRDAFDQLHETAATAAEQPAR